MKDLQLLTDKIKNGYQITEEEAMHLLDYNVKTLMQYADEIRQHFFRNVFDLCSIANGKSGKCTEDCIYCAQSSYYKTKTDIYPLKEKQYFIKDALYHEEREVHRYSIVTSGRKLNKEDIQAIAAIYKGIKEKSNISLCASHGLLDLEAMECLKKAGVKRYHCNLETSRAYFPSICTTHTYDEKIQTIQYAKKAGLEVCSGGIIGLGESMKDRIMLAFELRNLNVDSIPLNLLNPISGTPLQNQELVEENEFLKVAAIFRFINPKKVIRLAGGRNLLKDYGKNAFKAGINGTITGDLLTTCGNKIIEDRQMLIDLGYEIEGVKENE